MLLVALLQWCSLIQDCSTELVQAIRKDDVLSVRKLLQRATNANQNVFNVDQVSHFTDGLL